jgi:hypothetical protein
VPSTRPERQLHGADELFDVNSLRERDIVAGVAVLRRIVTFDCCKGVAAALCVKDDSENEDSLAEIAADGESVAVGTIDGARDVGAVYDIAVDMRAAVTVGVEETFRVGVRLSE